MASVIYPKCKENLWKANIDLDTDTVKVALVDTGTYSYSVTHEAYDDLSGVVGTPVELTNVVVSNGSIAGDDITFSSVTGNTVEAVILYVDSGTPSTSYLIAYIDDITNSPIIPNGGDLTIEWDDGSNIVVL